MSPDTQPIGLLIRDRPELLDGCDHHSTWHWLAAQPSPWKEPTMTADTTTKLRELASATDTPVPEPWRTTVTLYAAALQGALAAGREPADAANVAAEATVTAVGLLAHRP